MFDVDKKSKKLTKKQINQIWKAFIDSTDCSNVSEMDAHRNQFIYKQMKTQGPNLIKQIYIMNSNLGVEGMKLFVQVDCPLLDFIRFSHCEIDAKGAKILSNGRWKQLVQLDLQQNYIGYQGIRHLVDRAQFPKLREFNIIQNHFNQEGIRYLCKANWPQAKCLILNKNKINDSEILALATCSNFCTLTNLYISGPTYYYRSRQIKTILPKTCYFDLHY